VKKLLVVLAVLTLGALASAQTWYFQNSTGSETYCNFEVFNMTTPPVAAGTDNLETYCGGEFNATFVGYKTSLTAANNPAGFAVKGVIVGDNIYDAFSLGYTGDQWTVASAWKKPGKKGCVAPAGEAWVGVAGASGTYFGDNYGLLTCTPPEIPQSGKKSTTAFKIQ